MENNQYKYIARFQIETSSALKIGSGEYGIIADRLIVRDVNGLPYIPGTSLAGVIRHEVESRDFLSKQDFKVLFGYQEELTKEGRGSRIVFSPALMIGKDGQTVHEGLDNTIDEGHPYYNFSKNLADRDHVRINHKGAAVDKGKYEEEVIRKGTRFAFEIEMDGTKEEEVLWYKVLDLLHSPTFRIGGGSRKALGAFEVLENACKIKILDLGKATDMLTYLNISSSFEHPLIDWQTYQGNKQLGKKWEKMTIAIAPKDFFLFGAGIGDEEGQVDNLPKTENYFSWTADGPILMTTKSQLLIPATSIKGAIAHRTAFHYNALKENFIEKNKSLDLTDLENEIIVEQIMEEIDLDHYLEDMEETAEESKWDALITTIERKKYEETTEWRDIEQTLLDKAALFVFNDALVGEANPAVKALFGYAKQAKKKSERTSVANLEEKGARGKVIFSDIYKTFAPADTKIFNHVAIDRFTGGSIDGALFQEQAVTTDSISFDLYIDTTAFDATDQYIEKAFRLAIEDLKTGQLQLGGSTTKGHGVFLATA